MPRTQLTKERQVAFKETHLGRIILFCEGQTEKYYFEYFADIIESNGNKYSDVEVVIADIPGGNAQHVLNRANEFFADDSKAQKYRDYEKCLVYDCDAPGNIQSVITASRDYTIYISNLLFETWLLMHFEEVGTKLKKPEIYENLTEHLQINKYKKGQKGIVRKIVADNKQIESAISNAEKLSKIYDADEKSIYSDIQDMNPYTNIHILVEQLLHEITPNIEKKYI